MNRKWMIWMLSALISFGGAVALAEEGHKMGEMEMTAKGGIRSKSKEEQIKVALSAAPAEIAKDATVKVYGADGKLIEVKKGTNGFVCYPDISNLSEPDPICNNDAAEQWVNDLLSGKERPTNTSPGVSYMAQGGWHFEKEGTIVMADGPGAKKVQEPPPLDDLLAVRCKDNRPSGSRESIGDLHHVRRNPLRPPDGLPTPEGDQVGRPLSCRGEETAAYCIVREDFRARENDADGLFQQPISVAAEGGVDAPDPRCIERGQLSPVDEGKKRLRSVRDPIGRRHQPAAEKRRPAGEEADHHQQTADQFDGTCDVDHVSGRCSLRRNRKPEELLGPVP